jgi:predicted metal-dependent peptidase
LTVATPLPVLSSAERDKQIQRMSHIRSRLLLQHKWYGALSLRLRMKPEDSCPTMATDGTYMIYGPAAISQRTDAEIAFAIAHETLHCALQHPYRLGNRNPVKANIAMDLAINPILLQATPAITAWPGTLFPRDFGLPDGLAWEEYYNLLPDQPTKLNGSGGDGVGIPQPSVGKPGSCKPEGDEDGSGSDGSIPQQTDMDWRQAAVNQTLQAQAAGNLPGGLEVLVNASITVTQDWRAILARFIRNNIPVDYTWSRPNRRMVSSGLYLPSVYRENMPRLGVAVDTSGSISDAQLASALTETQAIIRECRPEEIIVVYCDAKVGNVEHFGPDDFNVDFSPTGRGGTAFQPALDYFSSGDDDPVEAVIYFSADLNCFDHPTEPEYPVLWITSEQCRHSDPPGGFGELIKTTD